LNIEKRSCSISIALTSSGSAREDSLAGSAPGGGAGEQPAKLALRGNRVPPQGAGGDESEGSKPLGSTI